MNFVLQTLIFKSLKKYLRNIEAFEISLFQGEMALTKLSIIQEAFESLYSSEIDFLHIRRGFLELLKVDIPWSNLNSKSIKLHIDSPSFVLEVAKDAREKKPSQTQRAPAWDESLIKEEIKLKCVEQIDEGMFEKFLKKVVNNISISVQNLSISIGLMEQRELTLTVGKVTVQSVDENGEYEFNSSNKLIRKKVTIEGLVLTSGRVGQKSTHTLLEFKSLFIKFVVAKDKVVLEGVQNLDSQVNIDLELYQFIILLYRDIVLSRKSDDQRLLAIPIVFLYKNIKIQEKNLVFKLSLNQIKVNFFSGSKPEDPRRADPKTSNQPGGEVPPLDVLFDSQPSPEIGGNSNQRDKLFESLSKIIDHSFTVQVQGLYFFYSNSELNAHPVQKLLLNFDTIELLVDKKCVGLARNIKSSREDAQKFASIKNEGRNEEYNNIEIEILEKKIVEKKSKNPTRLLPIYLRVSLLELSLNLAHVSAETISSISDFIAFINDSIANLITEAKQELMNPVLKNEGGSEIIEFLLENKMKHKIINEFNMILFKNKINIRTGLPLNPLYQQASEKSLSKGKRNMAKEEFFSLFTTLSLGTKNVMSSKKLKNKEFQLFLQPMQGSLFFMDTVEVLEIFGTDVVLRNSGETSQNFNGTVKEIRLSLTPTTINSLIAISGSVTELLTRLPAGSSGSDSFNLSSEEKFISDLSETRLDSSGGQGQAKAGAQASVFLSEVKIDRIVVILCEEISDEDGAKSFPVKQVDCLHFKFCELSFSARLEEGQMQVKAGSNLRLHYVDPNFFEKYPMIKKFTWGLNYNSNMTSNNKIELLEPLKISLNAENLSILNYFLRRISTVRLAPGADQLRSHIRYFKNITNRTLYVKAYSYTKHENIMMLSPGRMTPIVLSRNSKDSTMNSFQIGLKFKEEDEIPFFSDSFSLRFDEDETTILASKKLLQVNDFITEDRASLILQIVKTEKNNVVFETVCIFSSMYIMNFLRDSDVELVLPPQVSQSPRNQEFSEFQN